MDLVKGVTSGSSRRRIIGESEPMQVVLRQVAQVAPNTSIVLITGETGVGKDVIAQAIHEESPRKHKTFKAVNCGAFYQDLLQSELFGHEKGAFTDATKQRRGVFEQADGGTLFLDEVAEMSPEVQVKFLRVLETQEFTRLGGERNIKVNVRIIAATNVNLVASVREKKFRQDLYYRLNLFRIQIPPLRDRREDIPLFVSAFISELSAEHGKPITGITSDALNYLQNADWYGNVRELRNAIETAIISATTEELQLEYFPMDPESQQVSLVPVQTSGTQLAPTQIVDTTSDESDILNLQGGDVQNVGTPVNNRHRTISNANVCIDEMVGDSDAMRTLRSQIDKVAGGKEPVLIKGETGTGKELVANAIHRESNRVAGNFITLNCATLTSPDEVIHSELFGHERGVLPMADFRRLGRFEEADGGTLFLYEIGDMGLKAQAKVFRVIDTGEVEPLGGNQIRTVDVRIIAATNKNLPEEIENGRFRDDLFYRLNVLTIDVPPLRKRAEDIPSLVKPFAKSLQLNMDSTQKKTIHPGAYDEFEKYHWPGNIRQLENIVVRLLTMTESNVVTAADVAHVLSGEPSPGGGIEITDEDRSYRGQMEDFLAQCGITLTTFQNQYSPKKQDYERLMDTLLLYRAEKIPNPQCLRSEGNREYTKNGRPYQAWTHDKCRELVEVFFRKDDQALDKDHPIYTGKNYYLEDQSLCTVHPLYNPKKDRVYRVTVGDFFTAVREFCPDRPVNSEQDI